MEAMALKCPVVASDIPCIPELIRSGKDGLLVDGEDIEGFVKAMNEVTDDKKREKLAQSAYQRIQEQFLWSKVTPAFEELYHD